MDYFRAALTLAVLLAVGLGTANATYYDVITADNPVAYWRLNETSGSSISDSVGTHNGTLVGSSTLGEPGALINDPDTAIDFSGGYAWSPYAADLDGTAFSVECWARTDEFGGATWRTPLMYRWVDYQSAAYYPCYGYNFYIHRDLKRWQFWIGRGTAQNDFAAVTGPDVELGKWTHLVGTYDGTRVRFYVDGLLAGSTLSTHDVMPLDKSTFKIATGAHSFLGGLDEVAFYGTALSPEQVMAHYQAAIPEPSTLILLLLGAAGLCTCTRRRRR